VAIAGSVGYWALFYFASIQAVQPWGLRWLFEWVSAGFLLMLLAIVLPLILVVLAALHRQGRDVLWGLALCGICAVAFVSFHRVNWWFRSRAIVRVVRQAAPLTAAIRAYSAAQGGPPPSLEALVPRFLPRVPETGMGAYPRFEYAVGAEAPAGEPWALTVSTSLGILNWDILLYLPSGRYPAQGYGGELERFEDWAYVHE
jgi:hypothetical protein